MLETTVVMTVAHAAPETCDDFILAGNIDDFDYDSRHSTCVPHPIPDQRCHQLEADLNRGDSSHLPIPHLIDPKPNPTQASEILSYSHL